MGRNIGGWILPSLSQMSPNRVPRPHCDPTIPLQLRPSQAIECRERRAILAAHFDASSLERAQSATDGWYCSSGRAGEDGESVVCLWTERSKSWTSRKYTYEVLVPMVVVGSCQSCLGAIHKAWTLPNAPRTRRFDIGVILTRC